MAKNKYFNIWFCVDKSGLIKMFLDQPIRDQNNGIWVGKRPFVNSVLYNQIKELIEKSKYSWTNNPECITLNL